VIGAWYGKGLSRHILDGLKAAYGIPRPLDRKKVVDMSSTEGWKRFQLEISEAAKLEGTIVSTKPKNGYLAIQLGRKASKTLTALAETLELESEVTCQACGRSPATETFTKHVILKLCELCRRDQR